MKKIIYILFLAALIAGIPGCTSTTAGKNNTVTAERPVKTGFFVDNGSCGGGMFHIARLLYYSPQLEITLLDGKDIRDGKLDELELLVIPGGSSARQFKMMQPEGAAKVREFVKNGGSYVGICAGFHCTLNRPDRIALLPYEYLHNTAGAQAPLTINIPEHGAKILGIKSGNYRVAYSAGPLSKPGKPWSHGKADVLATYLSSVSQVNRAPVNFIGKPAILFGNHGKGKVAATSFHPESYVANHCIFNGMIRAVTGRTIIQNFPRKNYRPVRVALFIGNTAGKDRVERLMELDRHPDLDVTIITATAIPEGELEHSDVFIALADDCPGLRNFVKKNECLFRRFMERGGRVIASTSGVKAFEPHQNLIVVPVGKSFVDAALKRP